VKQCEPHERIAKFEGFIGKMQACPHEKAYFFGFFFPKGKLYTFFGPFWANAQAKTTATRDFLPRNRGCHAILQE